MRLTTGGNWNNLRLDGLLGWIHRLVMFITFPIRHFWLTIISLIAIAAILLIIPLYFGVKFNDIGTWYKNIFPLHKFTTAQNTATSKISQGKTTVEDFAANVVKGAQSLFEGDNYVIDERGEIIVGSQESGKKYPKWNVKGFGHAKYQPPAVAKKKNYVVFMEKTFAALKNTIYPHKNETMAENTLPPAADLASDNVLKNQNIVTHSKPAIGKLSDYYELAENRGLIYLQNPEIYRGAAQIAGANSLFIDNHFMFLYGIYSNPEKYDVQAAQKYLLRKTADSVVDCAVVAYAAQTGAATALCFVNGVLLNQLLVEQGLAQNVALKISGE